MLNVFELVASLRIDDKQYVAGLAAAKSKTAAFGGMLRSGLRTAARMGVMALTAASGAAVAFGKSAIDAGKTFDSSMSQVAATMGKTMDEMLTEVGTVDLAWGTFSGNLREYALEMVKNTAFSASQAADALNYMALAGYDVQTSMEMLPNVLNLAAAGGFELARASDMITDTQTAFGISLERTSLLVDEMAKAASTGNTSVEQLGEAFLTVGGLAQELNGGFITLADGTQKEVDGVQELEIALTAMANAGVKGSEAGTHMRNMIMKLSGPTAEGTKQLEAMGVSVFNAEGNMRSLADIFGDLSGQLDAMTQEEKIKAISALFNARDLSAAEALLGAVEQDWNKIGSAIAEAQQAGVMYDGQVYSMADAQAKFGDAIYDSAQGFKILGSAEMMAQTQLDNLEGDVTLFNSALEAAKIRVSDQLTPALREFVQFGTQGLSDITTAFQEGGLSGAMDALGTVLSDGVALIIERLPSFVDAGLSLLTALGDGLINNLPLIISVAGQVIVKLVTALVDNLPAIVKAGLELIIGLAEGLADNVDELIPAVVEAILTIVEVLTEPDTMTKLFGAALQIIIGVAKGLIKALPVLIEGAGTVVNNLLTAFLEKVKSFDGVGGGIVSGIIEGIKNGWSRLTSFVSEKAKSLLSSAKSALGIHSPSKLTRDEIGVNFAKGIAVGVKEEMPKTIKDIQSQLEFTSKVKPTVPSVSRETYTGGGEIVLSIDGHELARFLAPAMNSQLAFAR